LAAKWVPTEVVHYTLTGLLPPFVLKDKKINNWLSPYLFLQLLKL
jgi:hypothetical protein